MTSLPLPKLFFLFLLLITAAGAVAEPTTSHLCNGFDFPVNPPNGEGYFKSRGFRAGGHLGEDWLHLGGSRCSFNLPVHSIADGTVTLARDIHVAWGNVIVIRHAYLEGGKTQFVDSLYAHLNHIDVKEGDNVKRGQKIATIGTNHGMYPAHLHFEIHKNLNIGVNHTGFARNLTNYYSPTDFILKKRTLRINNHLVALPFTHFDIPRPWSRGNRHHKRIHLRKSQEVKLNKKK